MQQNAIAIVNFSKSNRNSSDVRQRAWRHISELRLAKHAFDVLRGTAGCGVVLGVKFCLTWLLTRWLYGSLSYLLVHIVTFFLSYSIHTRFTFASSYSLAGVRKYFAAVIGFKLLDYLIFSLLFSALNVAAGVAVFGASAAVIMLRFVVVRRILRANPMIEKIAANAV